MGELAAFSVEQEGALSACEARKDAAVRIIDAYNAAARGLADAQSRRGSWWGRRP